MIDIIGWRARLGVLTPPYNTVVEPTMYAVASRVPGVTVHFARLGWVWGKKAGVPITHEQIEEHLQGHDTLKKNLEYIKRAAYDLSCADSETYGRIHVIGLACTAPAWDLLEDGSLRENDEVIDAGIEEVSGIQGITAHESNLKALQSFDVKKIGVVMPYGDPFTNTKGRMAYQKHFDVVGYCDYVPGIRHPNFIYDAAKKADTPNADAIFISLTTVPFTTGSIDCLEKDLHKPVVCSLQAFAWNLLRTAGIPDRIDGYGRLFKEF